MSSFNVESFIINSRKKFPDNKIYDIKNRLRELTDEQMSIVQFTDFKNPDMIFLLSFLFGFTGIDRFLIGDKLISILKLLTLGFCGIWWIVDLFLIIKDTKESNYKLLLDLESKYKDNQPRQ